MWTPQWVHEHIRVGLVLISIKTSELFKKIAINMYAINALTTLAFKKINKKSLKERVVGTTKWVHKHIRSGFVLIGCISSELVRIEKKRR